MSGPDETIELGRCHACQALFLPADRPCPRCASDDVHRFSTSAIGRVIAATELVPSGAGSSSGPVLAFVEFVEGVRVLAVVDGSVPATGSLVSVRPEGPVYRARTEPTGAGPGARGEGESPRAGSAGPSFEPPR